MKQQELEKDWKKTNKVLHKKELLYILEIVKTELINRYHNDLLTRHFGIDKTRKLIAPKGY